VQGYRHYLSLRHFLIIRSLCFVRFCLNLAFIYIVSVIVLICVILGFCALFFIVFFCVCILIVTPSLLHLPVIGFFLLSGTLILLWSLLF